MHMAEESRLSEHVAATLGKLNADVVPNDIDVVIEQRVLDSGGVVNTYFVVLRDGTATIADGDQLPDITISQDRETAHAIRAGHTNAQTAYLTGRLTIDGDVDKLLAVGPALQSIVAHMAPHTN